MAATLRADGDSNDRTDARPPPARSAADSSPTVVIGAATPGDAPIDEARAVGESFLRSYVAFLYGRVDARGLRDASGHLARALGRSRTRVPPAREDRTPRVARVDAVRQAPALVQVTATVDDGDVTPYTVTAFVEHRGARWLVTHLADD